MASWKSGAPGSAPSTPHVEISRSLGALPVYAGYSLLRIALAYVLSLLFAVTYGYIAAYRPRAERFMIPLLDVLQSIPVLSFLPGVMLAMAALFPGRQLGVETGRGPAHFYRTGLEHGLQFLCIAEKHSARDAGSGHDLPFQLVAALPPDRAALRHHRPRLEFHDVGRRSAGFS